jgi:Domain of unknown function (DUF4833)
LAIKSILGGLLCLCTTAAYANSDSSIHRLPKQVTDTLPAPPVTKDLLFYIQRTSNINTIVYDVNRGDDGKVIPDVPIHIYWIRYAEDKQQEELTYVQRSFAYGISSKPAVAGIIEFNFVSYKKMKMNLQYSESDKKYIVWMQRGNKKVKVNRFFVKIDGGSFWFPKVTFIEIKGFDMATGKDFLERIKP